MSSFRANGTSADLNGGLIYATPPFSMMVDCIPYSIPSAGVLISQLNTTSTFDGFLIEFSSPGTQLFAATIRNNVFTFSGGIPTGPAGTRQTLGGVWASATSRQCFVNGQGDTIGTTSSTPLNAPNNSTIWAAHKNNAFSNFCGSANIFSAFVWNVALDASDFLAIYRGISPLLVRPGSIVEGWIFHNRYSNLGITGSVGTTGVFAGNSITNVNMIPDPIDPNYPAIRPLSKPRVDAMVRFGKSVGYNQAVQRAANW